MPTQLNADDARQSMNDHVIAKGIEIRQKFGPHIGWSQLQQILADKAFVRYSCEIQFDDSALQPGELAYPQPKGDRPEDGFRLLVRRALQSDLDDAIASVLYQLVVVNYGGFATPDDAEAFGASVLGISAEDYYQSLCRLADKLELTS